MGTPKSLFPRILIWLTQGILPRPNLANPSINFHPFTFDDYFCFAFKINKFWKIITPQNPSGNKISFQKTPMNQNNTFLMFLFFQRIKFGEELQTLKYDESWHLILRSFKESKHIFIIFHESFRTFTYY